MKFDSITGRGARGGKWRVTLNRGGEHTKYAGGSLLSIIQAIERDLMDEAMGTDDDFEPDLHDLTGETKHIGAPSTRTKTHED